MKRRWIAAIAALAALGVLVAVLFGIKIGQASSGSLASSGPAHETLSRLEAGGLSSGLLTPIEVVVDADQAESRIVVRAVELVPAQRCRQAVARRALGATSRTGARPCAGARVVTDRLADTRVDRPTGRSVRCRTWQRCPLPDYPASTSAP